MMKPLILTILALFVESVCSHATYNCGLNNPCTAANAANNKFYFLSDQNGYFVQCSQYQQCFVMPCPTGSVWNPTLYTCVPGASVSLTPISVPEKYNCVNNNPCTVANANQNLFYFLSEKNGYFVQCNAFQNCWEMPCSYGLVWRTDLNACAGAIGNNHPSYTCPLGTNNYNGPFFNCGQNNPCTNSALIAQLNLYYYPNSDPTKFVQCSAFQQCWVMPCPPGLVWRYDLYTCAWSLII